MLGSLFFFEFLGIVSRTYNRVYFFGGEIKIFGDMGILGFWLVFWHRLKGESEGVKKETFNLLLDSLSFLEFLRFVSKTYNRVYGFGFEIELFGDMGIFGFWLVWPVN